MAQKNKVTQILLLILTSCTWFLIGWILHSQWGARSTSTQHPAAIRLDQVRTLLENRQYLAHEVTEEQLANAAIRGMLSATQDPYAILYSPAASRAYEADIAGNIGAPGIWKVMVDGKIVVSRLTPGGGAARAGLQIGDILLGVDDIRFDETTALHEASILLRGSVGTTATILVQRDQALLEYPVMRDEWPILTSQVFSHEIGYLQQSLFPRNVATQMQTYLQSMTEQKIRALIWDLRDNDGGTVQATETILNYFLNEGILYKVEFKDGQQQTFTAAGNAPFAELPLVVLINEGTYSAAEIAAAALAENKRAVLIGTPTEGKGTIQDTFALDDQHLLRITIARWLTPAGEWTEGKGIIPTFAVRDNPATAADEVLDFALAYLSTELHSP
ncbi:MAG: PDZ domain-containing protein [Caldilineaceae bacterium]|nr:PDZ domain-containing protein [Caldilineaceae bacterium]